MESRKALTLDFQFHRKCSWEFIYGIRLGKSCELYFKSLLRWNYFNKVATELESPAANMISSWENTGKKLNNDIMNTVVCLLFSPVYIYLKCDEIFEKSCLWKEVLYDFPQAKQYGMIFTAQACIFGEVITEFTTQMDSLVVQKKWELCLLQYLIDHLQTAQDRARHVPPLWCWIMITKLSTSFPSICWLTFLVEQAPLSTSASSRGAASCPLPLTLSRFHICLLSLTQIVHNAECRSCQNCKYSMCQYIKEGTAFTQFPPTLWFCHPSLHYLAEPTWGSPVLPTRPLLISQHGLCSDPPVSSAPDHSFLEVTCFHREDKSAPCLLSGGSGSQVRSRRRFWCSHGRGGSSALQDGGWLPCIIQPWWFPAQQQFLF